MEITLSILICSVDTEERQNELKKLINELHRQISKNYAEEIIEIIVDTDNMIKSVGQKRNDLIEKARGEFICFIDDDDFISENYLSTILYHLNSGIDILLIAIEHIENGVNKPKIIPSLYIDNLNTGEAVFKTNHFHLCPHKKSIARNVLFECVNFAEDMLYSQKMVKHINNYFLISEPIYIYFDNLQKSLTRNV
jgi:glycosyltransferase involved in cell wall biosynthesis